MSRILLSESDRLRMKADRQDEMASYALEDGDGEAAMKHFAEAKRLRALARETGE